MCQDVWVGQDAAVEFAAKLATGIRDLVNTMLLRVRPRREEVARHEGQK